jgi:hypothetical protein
MTDDKERGREIIEAHQEMVHHIEQGAGRIRLLSAVTVVVALVLAASYVLQLALPLSGQKSVTVSLTDPGNVAAELIVLFLTLVWLYVGLRNFSFSSRMKREIEASREKEKVLSERVSPSPAPQKT